MKIDLQPIANDVTSLIEPFFENNISLIAILDKNFNFIRVNRAYAEADNLEPLDFIGMNHFKMYPNKDNEEIFKKVVETKKTFQINARPFDYKFNPERGITYWDWTLSPILDQKGEVDLLVLSLIDVTERVKATAEINNLFDLSSDILCITNFRGNLMKLNPAFKKTFNYTKEKNNSFNVINLVHPKDQEKTKRIIKRNLLLGTTCLFENCCRRRDNTYGYFEWNAMPDMLRKIIYIVGRDITKRKENEKDIEFLASVVDSSDDAIFTTDLNGDFLSWNKGAEKIFGFTADEAIGNNSAILRPPELEYDPEEALIGKVSVGKYIKNFETVRKRKDGKLIHLSKTLSPIFNNEGHIIGSSTIARDISERKLYESEIMKLDRLNILGELAASISHEVRNPMTTVRGFLQLLKNKEGFKEDTKHFDILIDELDRANSLISEFLSIGKSAPVEFNKSNLNQIIKKLIPLLQADALVKNTYIMLELSDIPDLLLNEKQIRQVIINLVRNGLEAMPLGGKLTIKTFKEKGKIVLSIQDEGCGIAPEVLDNLGKAFLTTKKDGTGLGLATSYSICKKHGAEINVDTGPGGSTFQIFFKDKSIRTEVNKEDSYFKHDISSYIFNEQFFRVLFNAIPLPTLIMNSVGNVYFINTLAKQLLQIDDNEIFFKTGREVLYCVNFKNSPEGCGNKEICANCIIKIVALQAIKTNSLAQNRGEFIVDSPNGESRIYEYLVSSSPFTYKEENLALVFMQKIEAP